MDQEFGGDLVIPLVEAGINEYHATNPITLRSLKFPMAILWISGMSPAPFRINNVLLNFVCDWIFVFLYVVVVIGISIATLVIFHAQSIAGIIVILYFPVSLICLIFGNYFVRSGRLDAILLIHSSSISESSNLPKLVKRVMFLELFLVIFYIVFNIMITISDDRYIPYSGEYSENTAVFLSYFLPLSSVISNMIVVWAAVFIYAISCIIVGRTVKDYASQIKSDSTIAAFRENPRETVTYLRCFHQFCFESLESLEKPIGWFLTPILVLFAIVLITLLIMGILIAFGDSETKFTLFLFCDFHFVNVIIVMIPSAYPTYQCLQVEKGLGNLTAIYTGNSMSNGYRKLFQLRSKLHELSEDGEVLKNVAIHTELDSFLIHTWRVPLRFELLGFTITPSLLIKIISALCSLVILIFRIAPTYTGEDVF